jgi:hypothetical protein
VVEGGRGFIDLPPIARRMAGQAERGDLRTLK